MKKSIDITGEHEASEIKFSPENTSSKPREFGILDSSVEVERDQLEAETRLASLKQETGVVDRPRMGDFQDSDQSENGRIVLSAAEHADVQSKIAKLQKGAANYGHLFTGELITAEYDIRVNNFSTKTTIIELPDGRKAFAVFAHPGSSIHRSLDGVMKHAAGLRMGKVSRDNWKQAFEEHARIPLIECQDPYTVLMPYIPNVNAHDVLANNKEIKNFGAMTWAGEVDAKQKEALLQSVVREISDIHQGGIAWGECILKNMIFDQDQQAIMCDPEIRYDEDVPLAEAQARDLQDIVLSSCAAMRQSEGQVDYTATVKLMLDSYADKNIISVLQGLCDAPFSLAQRLSFWNEKLRTGVKDREEYDAIRLAVGSYKSN